MNRGTSPDLGSMEPLSFKTIVAGVKNEDFLEVVDATACFRSGTAGAAVDTHKVLESGQLQSTTIHSSHPQSG